MNPIKFKEHNALYAKDQPEYKQLPVFRANSDKGEIVSCWQLSFIERIRILFTGKLWFCMMTFNEPPMPILPTTKKSEVLIIKKKTIKQFLIKNFKGGYAIPLFRRYLHVPKLLPLIFSSMIVLFIGESYDIKAIIIIGYLLVLLSLYCFLLPIEEK